MFAANDDCPQRIGEAARDEEVRGAPVSRWRRVRHRLAGAIVEVERELTQVTLLIWGVWTLGILAYFLIRDSFAPATDGAALASLVEWFVLPPTLSFIGFVWIKRVFRSGK